jgi:hypothetical protein
MISMRLGNCMIASTLLLSCFFASSANHIHLLLLVLTASVADLQ